MKHSFLSAYKIPPPPPPPPEMDAQPPSTAAGFSSLHQEIIDSHILTRLDGPSLASAACCSAALRRHSSQHNLWLNICLSTWPSTASARLPQLISTFPGGGPRAFFSRAFPLLSELRLSHSSPPPPELLLSAVDIHYGGKLIFTKLHPTETGGEWFRRTPFRVDLLEPKDAGPAAVKTVRDGDRACARVLEGMSLSWILIDPVGRRAVNLSSHEPVSVRRHWLTGELEVRFASIVAGDGGDRGHVQCGIVVTCDGEMQVKEARLEIEDMDGKHLNGEDSLVILQGALEGERGSGKNRAREGRQRYREFEEMKRERRERKLRREGDWDMLCVAFAVSIFIYFWCYFL